jgi:hypothetical protein
MLIKASNLLASRLKLDLLLLIKTFEVDSKKTPTLAEIDAVCAFMSSLMHQEVTTVRIPDVKYAWCLLVVKKLQQVLEAIGAECPYLTSLDLRTPYNKSAILSQSSDLGVTFFKVLPRLANLKKLQLKYFACDDWALQQIAMHCPNLL